jgi:sarcosine oxidase subunit delta
MARFSEHSSNPRGTHYERWRHINGCGRFFNAVRDTVSDKFAMTYKAGEPRPALAETPAAETK